MEWIWGRAEGGAEGVRGRERQGLVGGAGGRKEAENDGQLETESAAAHHAMGLEKEELHLHTTGHAGAGVVVRPLLFLYGCHRWGCFISEARAIYQAY